MIEFRYTFIKMLYMKRIIACLLVFFFFAVHAVAQCSICTRTAQQLGEKPAKALNTGIVYLAAAPLMIAGVIGYRWWKTNDWSE